MVEKATPANVSFFRLSSDLYYFEINPLQNQHRSHTGRNNVIDVLMHATINHIPCFNAPRTAVKRRFRWLGPPSLKLHCKIQNSRSNNNGRRTYTATKVKWHWNKMNLSLLFDRPSRHQLVVVVRSNLVWNNSSTCATLKKIQQHNGIFSRDISVTKKTQNRIGLKQINV